MRCTSWNRITKTHARCKDIFFVSIQLKISFSFKILQRNLKRSASQNWRKSSYKNSALRMFYYPVLSNSCTVIQILNSLNPVVCFSMLNKSMSWQSFPKSKHLRIVNENKVFLFPITGLNTSNPSSPTSPILCWMRIFEERNRTFNELPMCSMVVVFTWLTGHVSSLPVQNKIAKVTVVRSDTKKLFSPLNTYKIW